MSGETKTPVLRFRTSSAASAEGGRPSPAAAPWVEKRLGSVADVTMGQSPDGSTYSDTASTYILVQGNADLKDGWVCPRIWTTQITKLAKAGSLLMSVRAPAGAMGKTSFDVVLGRGVAAIDGDDFLYQRLVKMYDDGYWKELSCGSTFESLNSDAINNATLLFPFDIAEQQSIGGFFRELDALIAEREKALGKLESLKKAMLEKMFPQGDAKVPEVRFKGFEGEWEEKKLGECGSCQSGEGFPEIEQGGKTGIPFFKVSDMNLPGNESELIRANNYVTEDQIRKCLWHPVEVLPSVFFAKVGAAVMLNRKRLVRNRFLLDNNTMAFRLKKCIDPDFAKALFDTIDLPALSQTGALPSIGAGDVEELQRRIPSLPEQQEIGSFFRSLDALLAARREEAEKLKQLKKAFLERMFA